VNNTVEPPVQVRPGAVVIMEAGSLLVVVALGAAVIFAEPVC